MGKKQDSWNESHFLAILDENSNRAGFENTVEMLQMLIYRYDNYELRN